MNANESSRTDFATRASGACLPRVISCADLRPLHEALPLDASASGLPRELESPIVAMCARARAAGLLVEEALVQVKRAWREIPGASRCTPSARRDTRLERIVTAFIEHYFERPCPAHLDGAAGSAGARD